MSPKHKYGCKSMCFKCGKLGCLANVSYSTRDCYCGWREEHGVKEINKTSMSKIWRKWYRSAFCARSDDDLKFQIHIGYIGYISYFKIEAYDMCLTETWSSADFLLRLRLSKALGHTFSWLGQQETIGCSMFTHAYFSWQITCQGSLLRYCTHVFNPHPLGKTWLYDNDNTQHEANKYNFNHLGPLVTPHQCVSPINYKRWSQYVKDKVLEVTGDWCNPGQIRILHAKKGWSGIKVKITGSLS